jgi:chromosome partitioning related protein ParA
LPPEMLSAREFSRGTMAMLERLRPMERLRISVPPLAAVLNRIDRTRNATEIAATVRDELFRGPAGQIRLLDTVIPNLVAYREAAALGIPVHRHEPKRPAGRTAPSALETMQSLVTELLSPAMLLSDRSRDGVAA